MHRSLTLCIPLALAAVALAGPAADAAGDNQWATVNICDTAKHPNGLGIRGRAPGNRTTQNIWMRFFAQYRKGDGTWAHVPTGGTSPWVKLGTANFTWRETGWTFFFNSLKPGQKYRLRGRVRIEYRKNGNVVRSATEITEGGHHAAGDADPPGYSAATCLVTG
jgi:hypothetical protein